MEGLARRFERDGFVVLPELFTAPECAAWKAECRRILEAVRTEAQSRGESVRFPGGVFVGLALRSPLFAAAAADPRVVGPLAEIIGPNVEFLSDKVVFRDEHEDSASPWHQDYPYWGGPHKYSVWIALDHVSVANGCLRLLPGTHRGEVSHARVQSEHGFGNRVEELDEGSAVDAPLRAGGAVIFHDLALHASHPNRSGADRWAVITTYRDAQAAEPERMAWPAHRVVAGRGRGDGAPPPA